MNAQLPIHDVLDDLIRAVQAEQRVVLCAPPGAGKTTVVPLALLNECGFDGKIIMLEPRRLAARATAERCLLYTSPSPRDRTRSRMPSSA